MQRGGSGVFPCCMPLPSPSPRGVVHWYRYIYRTYMIVRARCTHVGDNIRGRGGADRAEWQLNAVSEKAGRTRGKPDENQNPAERR